MMRNLLTQGMAIGIVNRGEAAFRFVRALKEYNLLHETQFKSVAFYIDSEREAVFVQEADEAYALSSFSAFSTVKGSPYLSYSLLLQALQQTGCGGCWAGWGFVSEDADFVQVLEENNIVFLGPTAHTINLVGDKISSKQLAHDSKTPICPWSQGPVGSLELAYQVADRIGYPVIVKASNAGGGRGIRFVFDQPMMAEAYASAVEETKRVTGNDLVFIERLVAQGHHFEVQALADYHGVIKTFGVRDCSVQRKNQKIIEETPPSQLEAEQLVEMQAAATRLLHEANYQGAGTVEFIYDMDHKEFYFMEVNARLQVEHPITEELFGIDLVGGQIDVARGLSIAHYNEQPLGHVMELRLNAEDPMRDFKPAGGKVTRFRPAGGIGVRIDSGIQAGSTIPPDFDSMVAKIIVRAASRPQALQRLKRAIQETVIEIEGGTTNRLFALHLLELPEMIKGGVSTRFVEEYLSTMEATACYAEPALAAAAAEIYLEKMAQERAVFTQEVLVLGVPRSLQKNDVQELSFVHQQALYQVQLRYLGNNEFCLTHQGLSHFFSYTHSQGQQAVLELNSTLYEIACSQVGGMLRIEVNQSEVHFIDSDFGGGLKASAPGLVLKVNVAEGQTVKKGELLLVMEAMKMESPVYAQVEGVINEIVVRAGQQVMSGQTLIKIESKEQAASTPMAKPTLFLIPSSMCIPLILEYQALFLGYDAHPSLVELVKMKAEDLETVLSYFAPIHQLFSTEPLVSVVGSASLSWADHLTSYAHSFDRAKVALPTLFEQKLNEVVVLYGVELSDESAQNEFLYRLYRAFLATKQQTQVVYALMVGVKNVDRQDNQRLRRLVGQLAVLVPELTTLARDFNYTFFIKKQLASAYNNKLMNFKRLLQITETYPQHRPQLLERALGYGVSSEYDLASRLFHKESCDLAQDVLVSRLYRHCQLELGAKTDTTLEFTYTSHEGRRLTGCLSHIATQLNSVQKYDALLLVSEREIGVEQLALTFESYGRLVLITLDKTQHVLKYSNFLPTASGWMLDGNRLYFSPLVYRELRLYRLDAFTKQVSSLTPTMGLILATSKDSEKDERFVLYMSVESMRLSPPQGGQEMVQLFGLEEYLTEGIQALRMAQDKRKKRLYWNRVVIFVYPLIEAPLEMLEAYALKLCHNILDPSLGVERVILHARLKGLGERELVLSPTAIAGQFTFEIREPKVSRLRLQDSYEVKVMKAHTRGMFYPYELLQMLSLGQFGFESSTFTEYDLSYDCAIGCCAVERPYGQNKAHIVFGVIETLHLGQNLKRVIILSDATADMGSLAEPECRRINAALDLANELGVPVEWLPLSSGAKITMDSGTENLDWTAQTLRRIINFTQDGGEINVIVSGINVGAQSYWNSEATMLMHCRGLLIMTGQGAMLLTGKKALDFAGSVSASDNLGIGGAQAIMLPNGEAQMYAATVKEAYQLLMHHYHTFYAQKGQRVSSIMTQDSYERNVALSPYKDHLQQGFNYLGDIFSAEFNGERKKPFAMAQLMQALCDSDCTPLERMANMRDAETALVYQARVGGHACGLIGIESQSLVRHGLVSHDGPTSYAGGTLYPLSSKKIARAINIFSDRVPLVVLANLSGFDGSPESLRNRQLEWGAEIGRSMVNFKGPILFVVVGRYHGGAYVVFSKMLNENIRSYALEGSFASVIGGAPAAAVVFSAEVNKRVYGDERYKKAQQDGNTQPATLRALFSELQQEKRRELAFDFDQVHSVERAQRVGSIDEIISLSELRQKVVDFIKP